MRWLNAQCEPLCHELPSVNDVVDLVPQNHSTNFRVIDLGAVFYQVPLKENTHFRHPAEEVVHISHFYAIDGLSTQPRPWTNYSDIKLRHLLLHIWLLLLARPDVGSHLENLSVVLSRLPDDNLKLHTSKFQHKMAELKLYVTPPAVVRIYIWLTIHLLHSGSCAFIFDCYIVSQSRFLYIRIDVSVSHVFCTVAKFLATGNFTIVARRWIDSDKAQKTERGVAHTFLLLKNWWTCLHISGK